MSKPKPPEPPGPEATEAEREKFRRDMTRWCDRHRGCGTAFAHDATGLRIERELILLLSLSPADRKRKNAAATERLRNLLGRDFTIVEDKP